MTPPTLNDRRISSSLASRPLVRIDGAAGPSTAAATRTGVVRRRCVLLQCSQQPATARLRAAARMSRVRTRMHQTPGSSGMSPAEVAYSSSARRASTLKRVRLWLSSALRQRAARIDELDLVDDAFVALAAGDAKRRAGGVGARRGGRERIARGHQAIERLLHFEADLLGDLFLTQHDLALAGACLAHARLVAAAIEELPGEDQRGGAEVVAVAEAIVLALRAGIETQRQRRPLLLARDRAPVLRWRGATARPGRSPGGVRAPSTQSCSSAASRCASVRPAARSARSRPAARD